MLTLYRIVDVVVILRIERLSAKVFFLAQVQLSTRESSRVYRACFKNVSLSFEKIETLLVVTIEILQIQTFVTNNEVCRSLLQ